MWCSTDWAMKSSQPWRSSNLSLLWNVKLETLSKSSTILKLGKLWYFWLTDHCVAGSGSLWCQTICVNWHKLKDALCDSKQPSLHNNKNWASWYRYQLSPQTSGSFATSTPFLLEISLVWSNEPTFFVCSNLCHNSKRGCYWNCAQAYYWQVWNTTCELKEFVQNSQNDFILRKYLKIPTARNINGLNILINPGIHNASH